MNAIAKDPAFGDKSRAILVSGAGRHIAGTRDLKGYKLEKSDHPGFRGAGGDKIPVAGKATVHFMDNTLGSIGQADFLAANVTRPIFPGCHM